MDHDLQSGFYRDHHVEGVLLGPACRRPEWAKRALLAFPTNASNPDSAGYRCFPDFENDVVIIPPVTLGSPAGLLKSRA